MRISVAFSPDGKNKKSKLYPLTLVIRFSSQIRKKISLNIYLEKHQWDAKHLEVKKHPDAALYNALIQKTISKCKSWEINQKLKGKRADRDNFEEYLIQCDETGKFDFYSFMEHSIRAANDVSISTMSHELNTLAVMRDFKQSLPFNEINVHFVESFNNHLLSLNLRRNTIANYHKHIKKYIRKATLAGYFSGNIADNPYNHYQVKKDKTNKLPLTRSQMNELLKIDLTARPHIEYIRDLFIISAGSGLRFGDVMSLTKSDVIINDKGILINKQMQKVHDTVTVPLWLTPYGTQAQGLLIKYGIPEGEPLPPISNQKSNAGLKSLGIKIGYDGLTFHVARHTFCTNVAMATGSLFKVMELAGISKPETAQGYVKIAKRMNPDKL